MGTRTALRQNPVLTFGLLFVAGWVVLVGIGVVAAAKPPDPGDWVGRHGVGAAVGLAVLAAFLVLTVAVLGELGESAPLPQEWPPE